MDISFVAGFGPITREAVTELTAAGHRLLSGAHEEPWGQTTARLQSPEGLLVGVTFTPWMHPAD